MHILENRLKCVNAYLLVPTNERNVDSEFKYLKKGKVKEDVEGERHILKASTNAMQ